MARSPTSKAPKENNQFKEIEEGYLTQDQLQQDFKEIDFRTKYFNFKSPFSLSATNKSQNNPKIEGKPANIREEFSANKQDEPISPPKKINYDRDLPLVRNLNNLQDLENS